MKVARLPDGREFGFPDDMPDEQMDMEVQRVMSGGQSAAPVPGAPAAGGMDSAMQFMAAIFAKMDADKQEKSAREEQQDAEEAAREQQELQLQQASVQNQVDIGSAIVDSVTAVGQGLQQLQDPLSYIAQNSEQLPEIISAINNLSKTVTDVGKMIVEVLMLPRAITDGPDGEPRQIQTVKKGKV